MGHALRDQGTRRIKTSSMVATTIGPRGREKGMGMGLSSCEGREECALLIIGEHTSRREAHVRYPLEAEALPSVSLLLRKEKRCHDLLHIHEDVFGTSWRRRTKIGDNLEDERGQSQGGKWRKVGREAKDEWRRVKRLLSGRDAHQVYTLSLQRRCKPVNDRSYSPFNCSTVRCAGSSC